MDNIMQDVTHVEEIDGEEFASIIDSESSTINQSAFQRYAVPPQFDGNSSEEENEPQLEEKQAELVPDENAEDMDADNAGYAPLIADEFGEFVSSEDFEYHAPDRVGYLQDLTHSESNQSSEPAEAIAGATNSAASSVRVSIAPLDASKCNFLTCVKVA